MSEKKKKRFKMPHSFVIVFTIIVAAVAMTWILPAGEYVRIENADGIKVIDPTQFQYLERSPVNPLLIPMYIVKAFDAGHFVFRRSFSYADPVRFSAGCDCKAGEEILQQSLCVYSDSDADVWSDLYNSGR